MTVPGGSCDTTPVVVTFRPAARSSLRAAAAAEPITSGTSMRSTAAARGLATSSSTALPSATFTP